MKPVLIIAAIVLVLGLVAVLARRRRITSTTEAVGEHTPGKVAMMDPSQILYSLPTICGRMAPLETPPNRPTDHDLSFHEDDWRQIEFVPLVDSDYIASKLAELRQFKIDHRSGPGWTKTFVRPDHPTDFGAVALKFSDLRGALSVQPGRLYIFRSWSAPVESAGQVPNAFSFRLGPRFSIYGFEQDGIVRALGVQIDSLNDDQIDLDRISATLGRIAKFAKLDIVDWYQCKTVAVESASEIRAWLTPYYKA
jgi:hypothetical protein